MIVPFILSFIMTISLCGLDREVLWISLDERVVEHLRLSGSGGDIIADGLIIHLGPQQSFRLRYTIRCDSLWRFRMLKLQSLDEPQQLLELRSDGAGNWENARGEAIPSLKGCQDIDIFYSPFTNTLAIRRMALKLRESGETTVAFISVPDLTVNPVRQRYTLQQSGPDRSVYRYESLASGFKADLLVDTDGLVIEYPKFFRRAWSR